MEETLRIDVGAVLRQRLPRLSRWLPRCVVRRLERLVCQEQLNELLEATRGQEGADFCRGVLSHLSVTAAWAPGARLPEASHPRVILVSNHPLGGLDGMALIAMVEAHYGVEPRFVVNNLLQAVKPLRRVFLPVNKHGRQSRSDAEAIEQALAGERPVIIFPAGLVSRRGDDGTVRDLEWHKKFVDLAVRYGRDVVPVYFEGHNSPSFYTAARRRVKLGLKFNFEMALLPREVFRSRGGRFLVHTGRLIPCSRLEGALATHSRKAVAAAVKKIVYSLPHNPDSTL